MNNSTSTPHESAGTRIYSLQSRLAQRMDFARQVYQSRTADKAYRYLTDFFHAQRAPLQTFTIESEQDNTIRGERGTTIYFPKNNCLHLDNQAVVGQLTVELREVITPVDMVFSNMPSTAEGRLLESNAAFYINIHQSYLPLRLRTALSVQTPLQSKISNPLAMRLYRSVATSAAHYPSATDWRQITGIYTQLRRTATAKWVTTTVRELQWNCIASPYHHRSKARRTLFSIAPHTDGIALSEMTAFLIVNDSQVVSRMYWQRGRWVWYNLPQDQPFTIVAIGKTEQQFYYGQLVISSRRSTPEWILLSPISELDLITRIHHLEVIE